MGFVHPQYFQSPDAGGVRSAVLADMCFVGHVLSMRLVNPRGLCGGGLYVGVAACSKAIP